MNRSEAARIGGMDRQTPRDRVRRFDGRRPDGLKDDGSRGSRRAFRRNNRRKRPSLSGWTRSGPRMASRAGGEAICDASSPIASASSATSARSASSPRRSASLMSAPAGAARSRTRGRSGRSKTFVATLNAHPAGADKREPSAIRLQDEARIGRNNGVARQGPGADHGRASRPTNAMRAPGGSGRSVRRGEQARRSRRPTPMRRPCGSAATKSRAPSPKALTPFRRSRAPAGVRPAPAASPGR